MTLVIVSNDVMRMELQGWRPARASASHEIQRAAAMGKKGSRKTPVAAASSDLKSSFPFVVVPKM